VILARLKITLKEGDIINARQDPVLRHTHLEFMKVFKAQNVVCIDETSGARKKFIDSKVRCRRGKKGLYAGSFLRGPQSII
jgi:hypothetical protein